MILDHIDKLGLPDEKVKTQFNGLRSLDYLAAGLKFLYEQVHRLETEIIGRLGNSKRVFIFGNAPEMQGINQDLVACAFHWYAVMVCNYVKIVGWLANNGDSSKAREYLKRVLPRVYLWRNKVAAHFAMIDPKKDDNPADLAKSIMFPISFDNDAFYADSLTIRMSTGSKKSTSRKDMRWSLTYTHRNLIPRYWPANTSKQQS